MNLVELFTDLARIPSPSGRERNVAEHIRQRLNGMGVDSAFDAAGKAVGSDCGNLIAKLGKGQPELMFIVHMDTVEDGKKQVVPILDGGVIRSDGTTIVGSDDKAGCAALLGAMEELNGKKDIPAVLCVFSVREESGVMGVNHLKIPRSVRFVFDADGSSPPGEFIYKALGIQSFEIHVYGKAAHAAKNPEIGRNAIKAAGIIASRLDLGRHSDKSTLNIGKISGGTGDNIIPDYVHMSGETRAYSLDGIKKGIGDIKRVAKSACDATGCRYKLVLKESDFPLDTPKDSSIVALARAGATKAGVKFKLTAISATTQACAIAKKGFPALGLSRGGRFPHSFNESIDVKELEETKRLMVAITMQAAAFGHRKRKV